MLEIYFDLHQKKVVLPILILWSKKAMKDLSVIENEKRNVGLDIVKFIAIFMMIAVHCTDNVSPAERSQPWYNLWGSFYGSFMRPAIPLFVMVTGALLLPVKQSLSDFYAKRLSRLVVPFLVWSVLYNLFPWITGLLGFSPSVISDFFVWAVPDQSFTSALHNILMIPFNFSMYAVQMWYVYLLIGLYLYMPVFSAWIRQASVNEQRFFIVIWFISLFVPYLREFLTKDLWGTCSWNEFGLFYYFSGFNGYLLLGYYIIHNRITVSWKKLFWIGVPLFVVGYCITFFGFKSMTAVPGQSVELVELFFTYCTPNVLMMTLPIFMLFQKIRVNSDIVKHFVVIVSKCTLGIWMSHYLFLGPCYMFIESLSVHTMVKLVICTVLLLSITCTFVYIVRRTGQFGRWIMG